MGLTTATTCSESPLLVNGGSLNAGEGSLPAFSVFLDGHYVPAGCHTRLKMALDLGKARGLDGYERHPMSKRCVRLVLVFALSMKTITDILHHGPIYSCKSERCLSRFHSRKLKIHQTRPYVYMFTIRRILRYVGRWSQIMTLVVSAWSPFTISPGPI